MHPASSEQQSDDQILHRIMALDESALGELYDRYGSLLYSLAYRICRRADAAEEVVQETFMTVWRSAKTWQSDRGSVQAWLVAICRNRAIDHLRRQNEPTLPLSMEPTSDGRSPEEEVLNQAASQEVRDAYERLPEKYRAVLEAVYFNGLTQREAAKLLNIPHGTVKSRVRLAVERMTRALKARGFTR